MTRAHETSLIRIFDPSGAPVGRALSRALVKPRAIFPVQKGGVLTLPTPPAGQVDPTGHYRAESEAWYAKAKPVSLIKVGRGDIVCGPDGKYCDPGVPFAEAYGILFVGAGWTEARMAAVRAGVIAVANMLGAWTNLPPAFAFAMVYQTNSRSMYFLWGNTSNLFWDDGSGFQRGDANKGGVISDDEVVPRGCHITIGACTVGATRLSSNGSSVWLIKFVTMFLNITWARNTVVHELGHLFNRAMGNRPYESLDGAMTNSDAYDRPNVEGSFGFASPGFPWQQAQVDVNTYYEVFADMFLGWVFNRWEVGDDGFLTDIGKMRMNWMTVHMTEWLK